MIRIKTVKAMKPIYIIIHHSLTEDGNTLNWAGIRRYHKTEKGWADIGYHYGIERVSGHLEILVGRLMDQAGAHCLGMNQKSLGVCVLGNFNLYKPAEPLWEMSVQFVQSLLNALEIEPFRVLGHREVALDGRTCPGTLWDMDEFRSRLT